MNCEKISNIIKKTCNIVNSIINLHIKHFDLYFKELKNELKKQLKEE
jgi:hypothetical protein